MADDRYERTTHDGKVVDRYTDHNLHLAEERLGYPLTILQGSYNKGGVAASAGTHDGGGCVDLAPWDWEHKVRVLRELGFAAWYRPARKGVWPAHIHAVLIGNERLAPLAKQQVDAYRRGRDGLAGNGYDSFWRPKVIKSAAYKEAVVKPSDILDLSRWKLQANGKDIKQPALGQYSTWHMNVSGQGVAFRARVSDPTTRGSSYPRSELREMKSGGKDNASWDTRKGSHTLDGTAAIGAFPKNRPTVVFAQVHDSSDDVVRVLGRRRKDGKVDLVASYGLGKDNGSEDKPLGVVKQGERFHFGIRAKGGVVFVDINGVEKAKRSAVRSSCYFKAGAYVQSNTKYDAATQYGGVVIYDLKVRHAA